MPSIIRRTSLATTASEANVLAGSAFEYARVRCILSFGELANDEGLLSLTNVGSDIVMEEHEVDTANATDTPGLSSLGPQIPGNFLASDVAEPGDRIVVSARNPTGGTIVLRNVVLITNAR